MIPYSLLGGREKKPILTLEPQGQSSLDFMGEAPALSKVRVKVLRAQVQKGKLYDDVKTSSIIAGVATGGATLLFPVPDRWERPDLQWLVYAGGARAYKSPAIQDTYSAAWGGASSLFSLAPEDRFSICLEDEDFGASGEQLGCFDFTLQSYLDQVKSGKPLSGGDVEKLVLGPAVVKK